MKSGKDLVTTGNHISELEASQSMKALIADITCTNWRNNGDSKSSILEVRQLPHYSGPKYIMELFDADAHVIADIYTIKCNRNGNPFSNISQMVEKMDWEDLDNGYESDKEYEPKGVTHRQIAQKDDLQSYVLSNFTLYATPLPFGRNSTDDAAFDECERKKVTKESTKLFTTNVRGMTKEEVHQAFDSIVVDHVQLVNGGFALVFLSVSDAVDILDNFSGGIKLRSGKKFYPKPPKDKKNAAAIERARMTKQSTQSLGAGENSKIGELVSRAAEMAIAPKGVRIKLAHLSRNTTEWDIRNLFKGFPLCEGVMLKSGYGYLVVTLETEAERAVATLNKRVVQERMVTLKLATVLIGGFCLFSNYLNETVNEPIVYPFIDGDRSDRSPPGNHERSPTQNRKAALHLLVIKYNYVSLWLSDFPRAVPFLV
ncbi:hypothetical protein DDE83_007138 [Stemphylium lycopersici]|uniref:RRM domain-containing protein n=1 Tax=Stemphylium lycopersici TaxID=183478 RepID=A0A364MWW6_STELY|nr:hypothetical protein DDE83_007138 [Stemphylium lycopersici]